ncbi:MAG TPA: hypothetical protein VH796_03090 [Nitrososphaeraceae archaeon]|jgi:ABC-type Fe3+-siderophore transport system permease subunit
MQWYEDSLVDHTEIYEEDLNIRMNILKISALGMLGFVTVLSFVLASLGSGVSMIIGPIAFVILVIMLIQEKRRRGKVW